MQQQHILKGMETLIKGNHTPIFLHEFDPGWACCLPVSLCLSGVRSKEHQNKSTATVNNPDLSQVPVLNNFFDQVGITGTPVSFWLFQINTSSLLKLYPGISRLVPRREGFRKRGTALRRFCLFRTSETSFHIYFSRQFKLSILWVNCNHSRGV